MTRPLRPLIWPADETEDQRRIRHLEDRLADLEHKMRLMYGEDTLLVNEFGDFINNINTNIPERYVLESQYLVVDNGVGLADFTSLEECALYIRNNSTGGEKWMVYIRPGTYYEGMDIGGSYGSVDFFGFGQVKIQPTLGAENTGYTVGGLFSKARFHGIQFYYTQGTIANPSAPPWLIATDNASSCEWYNCEFYPGAGATRQIVRDGQHKFFHCYFEHRTLSSSSFIGSHTKTAGATTIECWECRFNGWIDAGADTDAVVENWLGSDIYLFNCYITNRGTEEHIHNTATFGDIYVGRCIYNTSNSSGEIKMDGDFAITSSSFTHNLLSATHGDSVASTVVRGDIIIGNSTPAWDNLAHPAAAGRVLTTNATDVVWSTFALAGSATRTYTFPDANIIVAGSASALASGRVPFVVTGGLLIDNAAMLFSLASTYGLQIVLDETNPSGTRIGIGVTPTYTLTANNSQLFRGVDGDVRVSGAFTYSGTVVGVIGEVRALSGVTISSSDCGGLNGIIRVDATSSITGVASTILAFPPVITAGGIIAEVRGLNIRAQKVTGVTTAYGVYQAGASDLNYFAGNVGLNELAPDYRLDVNGTFGFTPGTSVTPVDNGDVVIEATNNTTLTFKLKGSDATVRSATLTLA